MASTLKTQQELIVVLTSLQQQVSQLQQQSSNQQSNNAALLARITQAERKADASKNSIKPDKLPENVRDWVQTCPAAEIISKKDRSDILNKYRSIKDLLIKPQSDVNGIVARYIKSKATKKFVNTELVAAQREQHDVLKLSTRHC